MSELSFTPEYFVSPAKAGVYPNWQSRTKFGIDASLRWHDALQIALGAQS